MASTATNIRRPSSRVVGIQTAPTHVSNSNRPTTTTVTPTSTPPIRVSRLRRDGALSPSPLTTANQRQYYEDSTWRMYDRIQASRPSNASTTTNKPQQQHFIPPSANASLTLLNAMGQPSAMVSLPRYSSYKQQVYPGGGGADEEVFDQQPQYHDREEDDDDLIFDLEL